jgi:hypothetical protein
MGEKKAVGPTNRPIGVIVFTSIDATPKFASSNKQPPLPILCFTPHLFSQPMKTATPTQKFSLKKTVITRFSAVQISAKRITSTSLDTWTSVR